MSACRRWRCPSCGLFGRKARRRAAEVAEVAEAGHLMTTDQAQLSLPCPLCHAPDWAGWCCEACDPLAEVPRVILGQPRMSAIGRFERAGFRNVRIESWMAL